MTSPASAIIYEFPETFVPSDQKEYTWRFRLRDGETIVHVQIDTVDAEDLSEVVVTPLVFGPHSFDRIAGNIFGVTQWLLPMLTDAEFTAYLRCIVTTDYDQPLPHTYTRTMRLRVEQQ